MLSDQATDRLRAALAGADFRVDAIADLLGNEAHAALSRNETVPALRATFGGSPLETLIRLWPLQATVDAAAAERALPGLLTDLCQAGILERAGDVVRARVDIRPYADDAHDWWVASDLTPGLDGRASHVGKNHVLGISSASSSLAQLTPRTHVTRALDLGTGCGVQSLHLAEHVAEIIATDVNDRALLMTDFNARLNGLPSGRIATRNGSLYEPVANDAFDLIVTNPPFVISSGEGELLTYRDSGFPGDEVVRRVVVEGAQRLNPGGLLQVLANWAHVEGEPWIERVGGWISGSGCDAWVVQREVADPASYVELWLKDAGLHPSVGGDVDEYLRRYDGWLAWFDAQRIEGVGFGWLNLRRTDRAESQVRLEEWPFDIEQPLGPEVADWAARCDALAATTDAELLDSHPVLRRDVRQESTGQPGAEDPETIVLRQQRGMRRAVQVDTVDGALLGACDGDLSVREILGALAQLLDIDVGTLIAERVGKLRDYVTDGFLETPGG